MTASSQLQNPTMKQYQEGPRYETKWIMLFARGSPKDVKNGQK